MTKTLLFTALAAALVVSVDPAGATASDGGIAMTGHHHRALMRRKAVRRSSRGTGIVTGGRPTATGGTPGGMPDRQ